MGCGKSKADHPMTEEEKKACEEKKKKVEEEKKAKEQAKKDADHKKKEEAEKKRKEEEEKKKKAAEDKKHEEEKKKTEHAAPAPAKKVEPAVTTKVKKEKVILNGKRVVEGAKKGPKERPQSEFKKFFGTSEGNPDESYVCQDTKTDGLVIVFPLNLHDDYAIDQCEKILKLKDENVIPHTGYFRDEANHINMTAELPLLADLHTRVNSKKYIKKYFSSIDALKITSRIADGVAYCHEQKVAHRDIKAGNIYYTEDNIIKLGNFLLDQQKPKLLVSNPA